MIDDLAGSEGHGNELANAAAEAHYEILGMRRLAGSCGCGYSRMCTREGTGFDVICSLIDPNPKAPLVDDVSPRTSDDGTLEFPFFQFLVGHDEAEHWAIPEFGDGPGTPVDLGGVFDFDYDHGIDGQSADSAGESLDDRILHILAFHGSAQSAEDVAGDIAEAFPTDRVSARLVLLREAGFVNQIQKVGDGGAPASLWSWIERSAYNTGQPISSPQQGAKASAPWGYDVPGKMPRVQIQRMLDREQSLGLTFAAVSARVTPREEEETFDISLVGEVSGEAPLSTSIDVVCVAYDAEGDAVARKHTSLFPEKFVGFQTFDIRIWELAAPPARLRLYLHQDG